MNLIWGTAVTFMIRIQENIAYWSPQPRVVLYYGGVGAWDGIHVIGSFDEEDKEAAEAESSEASHDFEVTI